MTARAGVIVADNDVMIRAILRSMLAGVGQEVLLGSMLHGSGV